MSFRETRGVLGPVLGWFRAQCVGGGLWLILCASGVTWAGEPLEASMVEDFIMGIPKTELHVHLEGTIEPEEYIALVERNKLEQKYQTAQDVRQRLVHQKDLNTFIEVYEELLSALVTAEDFEEAVVSYARRVREQGVVYVEIFFDPQMHTTRGIELETVMDALARAQKRVAEFGLEIHYIACFNRDKSAESAMAHLQQLTHWSELVIGVGLDNPEVIDFAHKFKPVFDEARRLGFKLTTHLDVNVPNTIAHHWQAMEVLNVDRLDHALNTGDEPELIAAVKARNLGLASCVTLLYRDIPGRLEERFGMMRTLLDNDVTISLNSDDPGLMRGLYVGDLLLLSHTSVGFSKDDVVTLVSNGFEIAWMEDSKRASYLAQVNAFVQANAVEF